MMSVEYSSLIALFMTNCAFTIFLLITKEKIIFIFITFFVFCYIINHNNAMIDSVIFYHINIVL